MRGAASRRSAKIALHEDVLIGPAPYSAPAAYYVPLVTRMVRIDVVKGPAALRYGPSTVGGAIDFVSAPMAGERAAEVDLAAGSDRYGKVHVLRKRTSVVAPACQGEYVPAGGRLQGARRRWPDRLRQARRPALGARDRRSDGVDLPPARSQGRLQHRRTSHETYTGLTDADFAATPDRRYRGTALDRMAWDHWRLRAAHQVEAPARRDRGRHVFDRTWRNRRLPSVSAICVGCWRD
ncbi:MAG: hypothetical protein R2939_15460 [Kofleriaceae bacterium]